MKFSTATRQHIYRRARAVCEGCGLRCGVYQIHHRRPRGMGGSVEESSGGSANGLHLCGGCHNLAESNRDWAITSGWLVHQGTDPAGVPVRLFDGWFLLDGVGERKRSEPLH